VLKNYIFFTQKNESHNSIFAQMTLRSLTAVFILTLFGLNHVCLAQKQNFTVHKFKLPAEIAYYDNQFSGLFIQGKNLIIMSESRLQDNAEAKLYTIETADLEKQLADSNYILPYKKIQIQNLDFLRERMTKKGDDYEGLEAITITDDYVYLSVETATPSDNCYLLRGKLQDTTLVMDKLFLAPTPKPFDANNKHIYNAGYEAITVIDDIVFNIFEYNSFINNNNFAIGVLPVSPSLVAYQKNVVTELPFRITDITKNGKNNYTAINYFFKGGGEDSVYRVSNYDAVNNKLIKTNNEYTSYTRLISMSYKKGKFIWEPLWEFPTDLMSYNWEGIAAYKKGFFVINDKYTPAKPYKTVLLYLKPIN
jgi:hypothetical protein